jgi:hypothetical protein
MFVGYAVGIRKMTDKVTERDSAQLQRVISTLILLAASPSEDIAGTSSYALGQVLLAIPAIEFLSAVLAMVQSENTKVCNISSLGRGDSSHARF